MQAMQKKSHAPNSNHVAHTKGEDSMPVYLEVQGISIAPEINELHECTLAEEEYD